MKKTLWSKNFTLMFIGNIISSLGGVGLNIALGVIIFDQTQSTISSSIFVAVTTLPSLLLPLFVGSIVDKNNPLKLLIKNEMTLLVFYGLIYVYTLNFGFNYTFYLCLFFITSSLSVISDISGQSVTAGLMPHEFMSKGYAIMSTIHPLTLTIVAPIALLIYKAYGIELILLIYIVMNTIDILIESNIKFDFKYNHEAGNSIKDTLNDMKDGIKYIHNFKPIKAVFLFFTIVIIANGANTLIYPYFAQSSHLGLENYALLSSINSMGYMFGGFFHYFVDIPKRLRYTFALIIYAMFIIFESVLLFMPFIIMLIMKFFLGLGGMNSANIRTNAVQASVDDKYRGKVNGVFGMLMGFASIVGGLVFGFLAETIAIPYLVIMAQGIYLIVVLLFVLPEKYQIKALYNLELTYKNTQ